MASLVTGRRIRWFAEDSRAAWVICRLSALKARLCKGIADESS